MAPDDSYAKLIDKHTVAVERQLPFPIAKVWDAVATKRGLSRWFMATQLDIVEGGRFAFEHGWGGTITEVGEPHTVQFTRDDDEGAYLRFELQEADGGTQFRMIDRLAPDAEATKVFLNAPTHATHQPGGPGTHWSGVIAGYHGFAEELVAYLADGQSEFNFMEVCREYIKLLDEWHA